MSGYPRLLPTVGTVLEGMGAQEVGIAAGDTITAIDNTPVRWWDDLQKQGLPAAVRRHGACICQPQGPAIDI